MVVRAIALREIGALGLDFDGTLKRSVIIVDFDR